MLQNLIKAFSFANDSNKFYILSILNIPRHPSTINIPGFAETFGPNKRVVDIPLNEWRVFSKTQYESQKLKFKLFNCKLKLFIFKK